MSRECSLSSIAVLAAYILVTSCANLQYRATDEEILESFQAKGIPTSFRYFDVDSLNLRIRMQQVQQSGNDINLIFFHGSPSSISAWHRYMSDTSLVHAANLFAVDRPGYGYSNFGDEMTSIMDQAEIMNALIDHFQLKNVIAVGTSYGGPLVARMAVLNENIKSVVLISPAIDPKQEKKIWASRLTQWWLTRWLVPTGYRVAGDEKTTHAHELAKLEPDWHKVTVPVVHIHGTEDDVVPFGNSMYTPTVFSMIEVMTIEGMGHEIAWRTPEIVIPVLHKLISEIETKKP